jgi:hypothetical protein
MSMSLTTHNVVNIYELDEVIRFVCVVPEVGLFRRHQWYFLSLLSCTLSTRPFEEGHSHPWSVRICNTRGFFDFNNSSMSTTPGSDLTNKCHHWISKALTASHARLDWEWCCRRSTKRTLPKQWQNSRNGYLRTDKSTVGPILRHAVETLCPVWKRVLIERPKTNNSGCKINCESESRPKTTKSNPKATKIPPHPRVRK